MSDSQNETIPGGKYLAADGKTFVDAWGNPIKVKEEAEKPSDTETTEEEAEKPATRGRSAAKKDS